MCLMSAGDAIITIGSLKVQNNTLLAFLKENCVELWIPKINPNFLNMYIIKTATLTYSRVKIFLFKSSCNIIVLFVGWMLLVHIVY